MKPNRLATLAFLLTAAAGCGGGDKKPAAPPPVPVAAAAVETKDVPLELAAVGHVEPISTVSVRPLAAGTVTDVRFREGQDVKKGDVLFVVDTRPYETSLAQAKAILERDRASTREADENLKRYEELVKKDYVTREQLSQARAAAEALRATVKSDEANVETAKLNLSFATMTAPVSGRAGSLLVHPGNIVKASDDKPMVVINQIEPIYVAFSLPEASLSEVKKRLSKGALTVKATPAGGGEVSEGTLTFIDNAVDTSTGTITLKATFPNRGRHLWPGQFVGVSLVLETQRGAVVAPAVAMQKGQIGSYVYVVKSDDTVEARPVTVERTWQSWAVVTKGLAVGEKVVTDGQLRLAPGSKVTISGAKSREDSHSAISPRGARGGSGTPPVQGRSS